MAGHDCGYGVFVDELGVPIPAKENAKIIEPRHDALQFDPVYQKDGERDLILSQVIQERVLQVLRAFGCHRYDPSPFIDGRAQSDRRLNPLQIAALPSLSSIDRIAARGEPS
jgi:hypothetical protein